MQLRKEQRSDRDYVPGEPLIEPEAIKRGLAALSDERVNDTLLAEAGDEYAALIERFRGGKAEQNEATIAEVLGLTNGPLRDAIKGLMELGFLEYIVTSSSYKVPMLYRAGLGITQGKAFDLGSAPEDDEG
jgi:predicted ribosome quality control (RQC) complex YloA/Tae2 family protein